MISHSLYGSKVLRRRTSREFLGAVVHREAEPAQGVFDHVS
jgi:hypothetical protein